MADVLSRPICGDCPACLEATHRLLRQAAGPRREVSETRDDFAESDDLYWREFARANELAMLDPDRVRSQQEEKILELRATGMTQQHIAWKLGVSQATVSRALREAPDKAPAKRRVFMHRKRGSR